ncbi:MAG: hypothetical protein LBL67_04980 [Coriobacteriales bacterium]|nr:hypothetical protein [Coriobacteriales bacterium]
MKRYLEQKYPGQTFNVQEVSATYGDAYLDCSSTSEPKAIFEVHASFQDAPGDYRTLSEIEFEDFVDTYYDYQFNRVIEKAFAKEGVKVSSYLSANSTAGDDGLPDNLTDYFKEDKPNDFDGEIFLGSDSTTKLNFGGVTNRVFKRLSRQYRIKLFEPYLVVISGDNSYTILLEDLKKQPLSDAWLGKSDLDGFLTAVINYSFKNGKPNLSADKINREISSGHIDKIWAE